MFCIIRFYYSEHHVVDLGNAVIRRSESTVRMTAHSVKNTFDVHMKEGLNLSRFSYVHQA